MIDPTELRLDNLLYDNVRGLIAVDAVELLDLSKNGSAGVVPIEFKEQWLKRIIPIESKRQQAFIRFYKNPNGQIVCRLCDPEGGWIGMEMEFIHQVQNLYRALAGKDMEIDISE